VQIAILTERILHLTDYMKENKKIFLQTFSIDYG